LGGRRGACATPVGSGRFTRHRRRRPRAVVDLITDHRRGDGHGSALSLRAAASLRARKPIARGAPVASPQWWVERCHPLRTPRPTGGPRVDRRSLFSRPTTLVPSYPGIALPVRGSDSRVRVFANAFAFRPTVVIDAGPLRLLRPMFLVSTCH